MTEKDKIIELMERMNEFDRRLKDMEVLAEKLKRVASHVTLLTQSVESFVDSIYINLEKEGKS